MTSKKVTKKKTVAKRSGGSKKAGARSPDSSRAEVKKAPARTKPASAAASQSSTNSEPYISNSSGKFALAASLLALVLSVYAVYETTLNTNTTNVQVAGIDDRLTSLASGQQGLRLGFDSQKTLSEEDINRIDTSLSGMESTVAKLELASQASIDDIKANLGESVARWKLDEIHSLLTRVNRVYQISGEQAQAIAGLELAQSSLATIDNPRLTEVNTALAEDLLRLKADRSVDIPSINDRLVSITSVIPDLVLAEDARAPEAKAAAEQDAQGVEDAQDDGILAAGKTLFSDIGSLVKHKNLDAPMQPSLDEHGRFAVYESLRLQVHAAMLALLRRDNASYQSQLALANETLSTYFDPQQVTTRTIGDQLQVLQSFDISLNTQAISRALTALNRVMVMEN
ncbi:MAG: hypothetical protein GY726_15325 [Proteobacteria bacterium]|nr:hypothetical protein [Pseudomonadota bacterium]